MVHDHHTLVERFCVRCGGELALGLVRVGDPERLVCKACSFVQYQNPKVASGTIVTQQDKMVLLRRAIEPAHGKWVFPGGFVDRGETLEHAAIREAEEEAGIKVRIDALVGAYSYEGSPIVIIVYAATILSGEPRALDEALELCLFERDEIPWDDLAFPSTRDALEHYCERFWPSAG